jgi:hypothetical protein
MLLSLVYFVMRRLLCALALSDRRDLQQEAVSPSASGQGASRRARHPILRRRGRMLLAAASRILPRNRWMAFVASPRPCSGGTGSWSSASGRTAGAGRVGRHSIGRLRGSSIEWQERTRCGVVSGSAASCRSSACRGLGRVRGNTDFARGVSGLRRAGATARSGGVNPWPDELGTAPRAS